MGAIANASPPSIFVVQIFDLQFKPCSTATQRDVLRFRLGVILANAQFLKLI